MCVMKHIDLIVFQYPQCTHTHTHKLCCPKIQSILFINVKSVFSAIKLNFGENAQQKRLICHMSGLYYYKLIATFYSFEMSVNFGDLFHSNGQFWNCIT